MEQIVGGCTKMTRERYIDKTNGLAQKNIEEFQDCKKYGMM